MSIKFLKFIFVVALASLAFNAALAQDQQPAEPAADQPAALSDQQPAEPAADQPAALPDQQPAEPAADQPAALPDQQPAEPAAEAAPAPEAPATKPLTMSPLDLRKTGIVSVAKDETGKLVAIKLIVNSYDIPLDEGGRKLENMDGKKVRVVGTFSSEGGKRTFTVKDVEQVPDEEQVK